MKNKSLATESGRKSGISAESLPGRRHEQLGQKGSATQAGHIGTEKARKDESESLQGVFQDPEEPWMSHISL